MDAVELYLCQVAPPPYPNDAKRTLLGNRTWGLVAISPLYDSGYIGSAQASFDITGISSAYRELQIEVTGRSSTAAVNDNILVRLNGDTAANYDWGMTIFNAGTINNGTGPVVADTSMRGGILPAATATANYPGFQQVLLPNYVDTTFYKALHGRGSFLNGAIGTTTIWEQLITAWWRSAAVVNRVTLSLLSGANFVAGSRVVLYGVL